MNDVPNDCICRRLLELGIADALEHAPHRDEMFIAMQACLDKGLCAERGSLSPAQGKLKPVEENNNKASRRKRSDRRSGKDRRQVATELPPERERRIGGERRSGGDRRGLLEGEQYTPQQAVLNLRAWCNGHCKGSFDLQLDRETGEFRFHFVNPTDRDDFMRMLKKFKGLSGPQT